jgi:hypothetical protein
MAGLLSRVGLRWKLVARGHHVVLIALKPRLAMLTAISSGRRMLNRLKSPIVSYLRGDNNLGMTVTTALKVPVGIRNRRVTDVSSGRALSEATPLRSTGSLAAKGAVSMPLHQPHLLASSRIDVRMNTDFRKGR